VIFRYLPSAPTDGFQPASGDQGEVPGLYCVVLSAFHTENIRALKEFDNVVRFVAKTMVSAGFCCRPYLRSAEGRAGDEVRKTKGPAGPFRASDL